MTEKVVATPQRAAAKRAFAQIPMGLRTREALAGYLFLAPFLFFFIIFVARAVVSAVNMSFYDWAVLAKTHPYIGLQNYQELFNDDVWWIALKNTIVFAALTVAG